MKLPENRAADIDRHWQSQPHWISQALVELERLCRAKEYVTVADLWPKLPSPRSKTAMGAVIRRAIKAGMMEPEVLSGPYILALDPLRVPPVLTADGDPVSNNYPMYVYRSLLHTAQVAHGGGTMSRSSVR